jgi:hypothetical protein
MLKGGSRFPVAMADVFPHGCHLVPDSISEAIDYDEETKRRSPALDKLTGKPVFQVRVVDMDPELSGRSREVVVKVVAVASTAGCLPDCLFAQVADVAAWPGLPGFSFGWR